MGTTSRAIRARTLASREVVIPQPFVGGLATDKSYYQVGLQETTAAQDLIAPNGIATQRRGWTYDGTVADAAVLVGIARQSYVLSNQTRTNTTTTSANPLLIHNPSSAGTSLFTASVGGIAYLPRCVYRDELIVCGQDGLRPLLRYSGGGVPTGSAIGTPTWTAGQSVITGASGSYSAAIVGQYVSALTVGGTTGPPTLWARVLERNSATSATIEGVKASATVGINSLVERGVGFAWPAVAVYNAGTVSVAANVVTGVGTKWLSVVNLNQEHGDEGILITPPAGTNAVQSIISTNGSDTAIGTFTPNITNSSYAITRRLPFKDAAAHRGSLWGTGVAQFPDRVYVSPPGWNPSLPPGFTEPYDPTVAASSSNANDFLLSFVDVPSPYDGDRNIAILPSPNPLLVLKRYSVYGVFGSYPSFQVSLIADGAGCADIRSAISVPEGQFWASDQGVFTYRGSQIVELTRGRINREWRALYRTGVTGIVCGVVANHLVVIADGGGAGINVYVYDLVSNTWASRFSNFAFANFWRTKVTGIEQERLLAITGTGRVCDIGPAFDVANLTGNPRDADTTSPRLQATTGPALAQAAGIDGEARMLDVAVDANLYDASTPTTVMAVSVTHSGGLETPASRTKALGTITADTANLAKRTRFRDVNRSGRLHSLSVDVTPTDTSNGTVQVPELVVTFRDSRPQT